MIVCEVQCGKQQQQQQQQEQLLHGHYKYDDTNPWLMFAAGTAGWCCCHCWVMFAGWYRSLVLPVWLLLMLLG